MVKVKSKPLNYGLYGEDEFLKTDFLHFESINFRCERHNYIIDEHIHNSLFQVFIIEEGKIDFCIEKSNYLIVGPAIMIIPEKTLHGLKTCRFVKGRVLTISTTLLEKFFTNFSNLPLTFGKSHSITTFNAVNTFEGILLFTDSLHHEIKKDLPDNKILLENYCNILLTQINRMLEDKSQVLVVPESRYSRSFADFKNSVKLSCTPMKSIKQYAGEINITSVHLNRICQSITGRTALQIVHEYLILEAEKLLQQTDLQVAQIAYKLNFEDPAYFSRLFRKYTGKSPKEFRENNYK